MRNVKTPNPRSTIVRKEKEMPRGVARKGQGKGKKKIADTARDRAPPVKDVTAGPTINVTTGGVAFPPVEELIAPMRNGSVANEGDWMTVKSSNVMRIRWQRCLSVEFHNGKVYDYVAVPAEVWRALMRAQSHGSFLQTAIINKYRVKKDVP